MLEAHEALPAVLRSSGRSSRRVHAEYHASFVGSLSRGVFSLDIPPDSTPAFGIVLPAGPDNAPSEGGLEWRVRLCFLVAASREVGEIRQLRRDGRAGEWGASWKAPDGAAPLQCTEKPAEFVPTPSSWASMLLGSSTVAKPREDEWQAMGLDTVECEVPIKVWPSATLFRPLECHFDA
jgi:RAB6A-GEF complex partner protein 2